MKSLRVVFVCALLVAAFAIVHAEQTLDEIDRLDAEEELADAHQDAVSYLETLEQFKAEGVKLKATKLKPLKTSLKECHPKKRKARRCRRSVARLLGSNSFGGQNKGPSIDDALSGVDEWLASFKKRVGPSQTLWGAARAAVRPLLNRLRRTQHAAVQRLIDSNRDILEHVEQVATEHIFAMLKASRRKQDDNDKLEKSVLKRKEIAAQLKEKELEFKNNAYIVKLKAEKANNSTMSGVDKKALKEAKKEEKKLETQVKKALGA